MGKLTKDEEITRLKAALRDASAILRDHHKVTWRDGMPSVARFYGWTQVPGHPWPGLFMHSEEAAQFFTEHGETIASCRQSELPARGESDHG